jgi:hypothetical protein
MRSRSDSAAQCFRCLGEPSLLTQRNAEVNACLRKIGIDGEGTAMPALGLLEPVLPPKHMTEVIERLGKSRPQLDGSPETRLGLLGPRLPIER